MDAAERYRYFNKILVFISLVHFYDIKNHIAVATVSTPKIRTGFYHGRGNPPGSGIQLQEQGYETNEKINSMKDHYFKKLLLQNTILHSKKRDGKMEPLLPNLIPKEFMVMKNTHNRREKNNHLGLNTITSMSKGDNNANENKTRKQGLDRKNIRDSYHHAIQSNYSTIGCNDRQKRCLRNNEILKQRPIKVVNNTSKLSCCQSVNKIFAETLKLRSQCNCLNYDDKLEQIRNDYPLQQTNSIFKTQKNQNNFNMNKFLKYNNDVKESISDLKTQEKEYNEENEYSPEKQIFGHKSFFTAKDDESTENYQDSLESSVMNYNKPKHNSLDKSGHNIGKTRQGNEAGLSQSNPMSSLRQETLKSNKYFPPSFQYTQGFERYFGGEKEKNNNIKTDYEYNESTSAKNTRNAINENTSKANAKFSNHSESQIVENNETVDPEENTLQAPRGNYDFTKFNKYLEIGNSKHIIEETTFNAIINTKLNTDVIEINTKKTIEEESTRKGMISFYPHENEKSYSLKIPVNLISSGENSDSSGSYYHEYPIENLKTATEHKLNDNSKGNSNEVNRSRLYSTDSVYNNDPSSQSTEVSDNDASNKYSDEVETHPDNEGDIFKLNTFAQKNSKGNGVTESGEKINNHINYPPNLIIDNIHGKNFHSTHNQSQVLNQNEKENKYTETNNPLVESIDKNKMVNHKDMSSVGDDKKQLINHLNNSEEENDHSVTELNEIKSPSRVSSTDYSDRKSEEEKNFFSEEISPRLTAEEGNNVSIKHPQNQVNKDLSTDININDIESYTKYPENVSDYESKYQDESGAKLDNINELMLRYANLVNNNNTDSSKNPANVGDQQNNSDYDFDDVENNSDTTDSIDNFNSLTDASSTKTVLNDIEMSTSESIHQPHNKLTDSSDKEEPLSIIPEKEVTFIEEYDMNDTQSNESTPSADGISTHDHETSPERKISPLLQGYYPMITTEAGNYELLFRELDDKDYIGEDINLNEQYSNQPKSITLGSYDMKNTEESSTEDNGRKLEDEHRNTTFNWVEKPVFVSEIFGNVSNYTNNLQNLTTEFPPMILSKFNNKSTTKEPIKNRNLNQPMMENNSQSSEMDSEELSSYENFHKDEEPDLSIKSISNTTEHLKLDLPYHRVSSSFIGEPIHNNANSSERIFNISSTTTESNSYSRKTSSDFTIFPHSEEEIDKPSKISLRISTARNYFSIPQNENLLQSLPVEKKSQMGKNEGEIMANQSSRHFENDTFDRVVTDRYSVSNHPPLWNDRSTEEYAFTNSVASAYTSNETSNDVEIKRSGEGKLSIETNVTDGRVDHNNLGDQNHYNLVTDSYMNEEKKKIQLLANTQETTIKYILNSKVKTPLQTTDMVLPEKTGLFTSDIGNKTNSKSNFHNVTNESQPYFANGSTVTTQIYENVDSNVKITSPSTFERTTNTIGNRFNKNLIEDKDDDCSTKMIRCVTEQSENTNENLQGRNFEYESKNEIPVSMKAVNDSLELPTTLKTPIIEENTNFGDVHEIENYITEKDSIDKTNIVSKQHSNHKVKAAEYITPEPVSTSSTFNNDNKNEEKDDGIKHNEVKNTTMEEKNDYIHAIKQHTTNKYDEEDHNGTFSNFGRNSYTESLNNFHTIANKENFLEDKYLIGTNKTLNTLINEDKETPENYRDTSDIQNYHSKHETITTSGYLDKITTGNLVNNTDDNEDFKDNLNDYNKSTDQYDSQNTTGKFLKELSKESQNDISSPLASAVALNSQEKNASSAELNSNHHGFGKDKNQNDKTFSEENVSNLCDNYQDQSSEECLESNETHKNIKETEIRNIYSTKGESSSTEENNLDKIQDINKQDHHLKSCSEEEGVSCNNNYLLQSVQQAKDQGEENETESDENFNLSNKKEPYNFNDPQNIYFSHSSEKSFEENKVKLIPLNLTSQSEKPEVNDYFKHSTTQSNFDKTKDLKLVPYELFLKNNTEPETGESDASLRYSNSVLSSTTISYENISPDLLSSGKEIQQIAEKLYKNSNDSYSKSTSKDIFDGFPTQLSSEELSSNTKYTTMTVGDELYSKSTIESKPIINLMKNRVKDDVINTNDNNLHEDMQPESQNNTYDTNKDSVLETHFYTEKDINVTPVYKEIDETKLNNSNYTNNNSMDTSKYYLDSEKNNFTDENKKNLSTLPLYLQERVYSKGNNDYNNSNNDKTDWLQLPNVETDEQSSGEIPNDPKSEVSFTSNQKKGIPAILIFPVVLDMDDIPLLDSPDSRLYVVNNGKKTELNVKKIKNLSRSSVHPNYLFDKKNYQDSDQNNRRSLAELDHNYLNNKRSSKNKNTNEMKRISLVGDNYRNNFSHKNNLNSESNWAENVEASDSSNDIDKFMKYASKSKQKQNEFSSEYPIKVDRRIYNKFLHMYGTNDNRQYSSGKYLDIPEEKRTFNDKQRVFLDHRKITKYDDEITTDKNIIDVIYTSVKKVNDIFNKNKKKLQNTHLK